MVINVLNRLRLASLLIFSGVVLACQKSTVVENIQLIDVDYLIFGHFYGECLGEECIEIFRLERDQLLEDIDAVYPDRQNVYSGDFTVLKQEKFDQAKTLLEFFPKELLEEDRSIFGCPDCADQGGFYIEYSTDQVKQFWVVDMNMESVPAYLQVFLGKIKETIVEIQKVE